MKSQKNDSPSKTLDGNFQEFLSHLSLAFFLVVIPIVGIAHAETVEICPLKTFKQKFATACSFTSKPGEEIKVVATYHDNAKSHSAEVFLLTSPGGIIWSSWVKADKTVTYSKYIENGKGKPTKIQFDIPNYEINDTIDIRVYAERSNLHAEKPKVDSTTGDLTFGWKVTTSMKYNPPKEIAAQYWEGSGPTSLVYWQGYEWTSPCYNKASPCSHVLKTPFGNRAAVSKGLNYIIGQVDPDNHHAETDDSTNDNWASVFLGNFLEEKIPAIMTKFNAEWKLPSKLLDQWFNANDKQKDEGKNSFDWGLPIYVPDKVSWFNSSAHAKQVVIDNYNKMFDPKEFWTSAVLKEVKELINKKFKDNPGKTKIDLSTSWSAGKTQDYHKQHITHFDGQSFWDMLMSSKLDATTAGFGNFSFYLVPKGTAKKEGSKKVVKIIKVAVHVTDSYDFNGSQPYGLHLGCWKEPGSVSTSSSSGHTCVYNEDFRKYRKLKARGADFTAFMKPVTKTLNPPIEFSF